MGLFSFFTKPKDPAEECAQRIALASGLLSECPVCRDIVDARAKESAWSEAEALAGKSPDCGSQSQVMASVRKLVDEADINCICDNDG